MYLYIATIASFIIFLFSYLHDRRKVVNGFLFNIFLLLVALSFAYFAFVSDDPILLSILGLGAIIFLFLVVFGVFILMVVLFINARILIKREGFSLSNLLTLFLGLGILIAIIVSTLNWSTYPLIVNQLLGFTYLVLAYFFFMFLNFLMSSFIYQIVRPRRNKDFIIVLGSGLIDGHIVSPLLSNRIEKAIAFYKRQAKKKAPPRIVFSGGKGDDEQLAEAEAMQAYALERGIPKENTFVEDKSTTTYQNMEFSKQLMDRISEGKYRVIFTTSNYHVFRSSIYAKKVGLPAQGIGAKTPFYFWSNAIIREYIAFLVMYKKWHIGFIVLMFIAYFALIFITYYFPLSML